VRSILLACLCGVAASVARFTVAAPAPCQADAAWTQPAPPLKIYGDTWFVGTCGLSSILITSPQGHILIDGDVEADAPLIEASIRALGFRLKDVRYILNSHEHSDHAGGIARLQHDSGATVLAREPAIATLERGRSDRSDPQFLIGKRFPKIAHVQRIGDGDALRVGALVLTAHATPGHTPGSTTWTWQSCENERCLNIVYADSLTAMTDDVYRYSDAGALGEPMRHSIALIRDLPCDILLTPHPDASDLWLRLGASATQTLIDPTRCQRYAHAAEGNLDARLAREAQAQQP
jgi:metallo-beta-lactamase class B